MVKGVPALDLPYIEDSTAEVDMNVVATDTGSGVQLTAADGRNITVANFAAGGATASSWTPARTYRAR